MHLTISKSSGYVFFICRGQLKTSNGNKFREISND